MKTSNVIVTFSCLKSYNTFLIYFSTIFNKVEMNKSLTDLYHQSSGSSSYDHHNEGITEKKVLYENFLI